ncbi:MAG TPA: DNA polymerase III subunit delta' [Myxococcota bacterium]|jgi:DNA polymerase-3 subunit delta'
MASFLLGQDHIERALSRALASDRLAHGLLFTGPSGVGRERAARGLAAGLVCENKIAPFGCQACRNCRRAMAGHHPDVHVLMPEAEAVRRGIAEPDGKRKPSHDILVDAVRELAVRLRMAPYEGGARVAIVVDAHRMNGNAQNALLKTLEEPAQRTFLILVAPHVRTVLPTIASRCLRLAFAPLSEEDVLAVLTALAVSDAALRAKASQGSVARALAADPSAPPGAGAALLHALLGGSPAAKMDMAEALGKERSDVDAALADVEQRLAGRMRGDDWRRAITLLERVADARAAIAGNAAVQLCLEELLLSGAPAAG